MSDNVQVNDGTGTNRIATDEVDYSGENAQVQLVRLVGVSGAEGSKVVGVAPQATEATLTAINAKVPAFGQAPMAASTPVVLASNQTAIPVSEPALVLTGQATQTAAIANILEATAGPASLDVSGFRSASVQIVSTGTAGTYIFEQSNNNSDFRPLPVFNSELATSVPITGAITATASQIIYTVPLRCRFFRLRIVTPITGGSIQAFSRLSTESWTATVQAVGQPTAANLNATISGTVTASNTAGTAAEDAAASGNPVMAGGVVRAANTVTSLVAGDAARHTMTTAAALVQKPYCVPQVEFMANLALTAITDVAVANAAGAGIRNHLTSFWALNSGVATDLVIRDGTTERARYPLPPNVPVPVTFPTGFPTTANTALNAQLSVASTVRLVATGYTAP